MRSTILLTTGTTRFDTLVYAVINDSVSFGLNSFIIQSPSIKNIEINCDCEKFEYVDNIESYVNKCEIIITHAGAGNVYRLLENTSITKKIIVVPNLERKDKHQADLARFIEEKRYAFVCWDVNEIYTAIDIAVNYFERQPYSKVSFFKSSDILKDIL